jgi:hypothetical protein
VLLAVGLPHVPNELADLSGGVVDIDPAARPIPVDVDWRSDLTGGPLSTVEYQRSLLHLAAWSSAVQADEPIVVVEQRVFVEADWADRLEALDEAIEMSEGGLVAAVDLAGSAALGVYAVTPDVAAQLLNEMAAGARPVEAVVSDVLGSIDVVDSAVARCDPPDTGGDAAVPVRVVTIDSLADAADGDVVLVVDDECVVVADRQELALRASSVVQVDGAVMLGTAQGVRAAHTGGGEDWEQPELVRDLVWRERSTSFVRLGSRWRHVESGSDAVVHVVAGASSISLERAGGLIDEQGDDLARILGYRGAVRSGPLRHVGAEIVAVPFWTPAMCATVIRAAEACGDWGFDPDDPVPASEVSLSAISPRLMDSVSAQLSGLVLPQLRELWPQIEFGGLVDVFVIRYLPGSSDRLRLHHDRAQLSSAVRLNDTFDGGVLEFPRQDVDNRSTEVGDLLAWPSLVTHPHRSTPVTGGVKYSLTIWWDFPALAASRRT